MTEKKAASAVAEDVFDVSEADSIDEAEMEVLVNGKPTGWTWTFAGPGHPQTIALGDKMAKERLAEERLQEQARVNGRKWKAPVETVDDARSRNVGLVVGRLLGWSPVKMNGEDYPFSPANAKTLLMDHRKGQLLLQALEFIGDENSFTPRSETA
ncbi:hypothetical protein [Pelagibius sp.]|uniref:hypothetical protein n=1 Tax=Pelagibius sp. TaxID=1931238 RepID=UPI003BAF403B